MHGRTLMGYEPVATPWLSLCDRTYSSSAERRRGRVGEFQRQQQNQRSVRNLDKKGAVFRRMTTLHGRRNWFSLHFPKELLTAGIPVCSVPGASTGGTIHWPSCIPDLLAFVITGFNPRVFVGSTPGPSKHVNPHSSFLSCHCKCAKITECARNICARAMRILVPSTTIRPPPYPRLHFGLTLHHVFFQLGILQHPSSLTENAFVTKVLLVLSVTLSFLHSTHLTLWSTFRMW